MGSEMCIRDSFNAVGVSFTENLCFSMVLGGFCIENQWFSMVLGGFSQNICVFQWFWMVFFFIENPWFSMVLLVFHKTSVFFLWFLWVFQKNKLNTFTAYRKNRNGAAQLHPYHNCKFVDGLPPCRKR